MALIRCRDCGRMISDRAGTCPHCGRPGIPRLSFRRPPVFGILSLVLMMLGLTRGVAGLILSIAAVGCGLVSIIRKEIKILPAISFALLSIFLIITAGIAVSSRKEQKEPVQYQAAMTSIPEAAAGEPEDGVRQQYAQDESGILLRDRKYGNQTAAAEMKGENILSSGIYIAGHDIEAGQYHLDVVTGAGAVRLYHSYDDYLADDRTYYQEYELAAGEGISGSAVGSLRMEAGECILVDSGLAVKYEQAGNLHSFIDLGNVAPGIYMIGEDILSGTYSITAQEGEGDIYIYNTYNEFKQEPLSYREVLKVTACDAASGTEDEDSDSGVSGDIRFAEGECLLINSGLSLKFVKAGE